VTTCVFTKHRLIDCFSMMICDHTLLTEYTQSASHLDLSKCRSIAEIQAALAKTAASSESSTEWLVARGWHQENLLEKRCVRVAVLCLCLSVSVCLYVRVRNLSS
jgi:predicted amidohydrolase YtcJ